MKATMRHFSDGGRRPHRKREANRQTDRQAWLKTLPSQKLRMPAVKITTTRMNSSRMHTARTLPYGGSLSRWVSVQGGSLSRWVSVQGGHCPDGKLCPEGDLCPGGSLSRGSLRPGGLSPGGSLSRGVSVQALREIPTLDRMRQTPVKT